MLLGSAMNGDDMVNINDAPSKNADSEVTIQGDVTSSETEVKADDLIVVNNDNVVTDEDKNNDQTPAEESNIHEENKNDNLAASDGGVEANDTGLEANNTGVATSGTGLAASETSLVTSDTGLASNDTGLASNDTGVTANDNGLATSDTSLANNDSGLTTSNAGLASNDTSVAAINTQEVSKSILPLDQTEIEQGNTQEKVDENNTETKSSEDNVKQEEKTTFLDDTNTTHTTNDSELQNPIPESQTELENHGESSSPTHHEISPQIENGQKKPEDDNTEESVDAAPQSKDDIDFDLDIDEFLKETDGTKVSSLEDELTQFTKDIQNPSPNLLSDEDEVENNSKNNKARESVVNMDALAYESDFLTRRIQESRDQQSYLQQKLHSKEKELESAENKIKDLQLRLIRHTKDDMAKDQHIAKLEEELKTVSGKVEEMLNSEKTVQDGHPTETCYNVESKRTNGPANNEASKFCLIL